MKIKLWLEKNKIYFETVLFVLLSFMSIIVSIASIMVSTASNKISQESYNLQINDRLPNFVIQENYYTSGEIMHVANRIITHSDGRTESEPVYGSYRRSEYILFNEGGIVKDAKLAIDVILVFIDKYGNQVGLIVIDDLDDVMYDYANDCFKYKPDNMIEMIKDNFNRRIHEKDYAIEAQFLITGELSYVDFQNHHVIKHYNIEVPDSEIFDYSNLTILQNLRIDYNSINEGEILNSIKSMDILKFETLKN